MSLQAKPVVEQGVGAVGQELPRSCMQRRAGKDEEQAREGGGVTWGGHQCVAALTQTLTGLTLRCSSSG